MIKDSLAFITNGDTKRGVAACKVFGKELKECTSTAHSKMTVQGGIALIDAKIIISNMCHNTISVCDKKGSELSKCQSFSDTSINSPDNINVING